MSQGDNFVADSGSDALGITRSAHPPGPKAGVLVGQQLLVEVGLHRAGADQRPESVHASLARGFLVENELVQLGPYLHSAALAQEPLGDVSEVDIRAVQALDELIVRFLGEVEEAARPRPSFPNWSLGTRGGGRVLVAHAIKPAPIAVDALGIASPTAISPPVSLPLSLAQACTPSWAPEARPKV